MFEGWLEVGVFIVVIFYCVFFLCPDAYSSGIKKGKAYVSGNTRAKGKIDKLGVRRDLMCYIIASVLITTLIMLISVIFASLASLVIFILVSVNIFSNIAGVLSVAYKHTN